MARSDRWLQSARCGAALVVFGGSLALGGGVQAQDCQADVSQLSQKQDTTDPKDAVCAKCLAIAHLDHALGGDGPVAIVPRVAPDAPSAFVTATVDLGFHARYRSRAPPSFS